MDNLINPPPKDGKKSPWRQIKAWFNSISTYSLVIIPVVAALLVGLGWPWLLKKIYSGNPPELPLSIGTIVSLFLLGAMGVPIILRKEFPPMTFISVKGIAAVLFGLIYIVFWWGLALAEIRQIYRLLIGQ
jgi:hypothetical protein